MARYTGYRRICGDLQQEEEETIAANSFSGQPGTECPPYNVQKKSLVNTQSLGTALLEDMFSRFVLSSKAFNKSKSENNVSLELAAPYQQ